MSSIWNVQKVQVKEIAPEEIWHTVTMRSGFIVVWCLPKYKEAYLYRTKEREKMSFKNGFGSSVEVLMFVIDSIGGASSNIEGFYSELGYKLKECDQDLTWTF